MFKVWVLILLCLLRPPILELQFRATLPNMHYSGFGDCNLRTRSSFLACITIGTNSRTTFLIANCVSSTIEHQRFDQML